MSLRNATSPEERGAPGLGVRLVAGYTLVAALVLGLAAEARQLRKYYVRLRNA